MHPGRISNLFSIMQILHYLCLFAGVSSRVTEAESITRPVALMRHIPLVSNVFGIASLHYTACVVSIVPIFFFN